MTDKTSTYPPWLSSSDSRPPIRDYVEHVRNRPGMFIGGTGEPGLLNMFQDAFQALANVYVVRNFSDVSATVHEDLSFSTELRGRGAAQSFADEMVPRSLQDLTEYTRPNGQRNDYQLGNSYESLDIANILSEWMEITTVHSGVESVFRWERGKRVSAEELPDVATIDELQVRCLPDPQVFGEHRMTTGIAQKIFATAIPLLRPDSFTLHDLTSHEEHITPNPSEGAGALTSLYTNGRTLLSEPVRLLGVAKDDNGDSFELDFAIQFHDEPGESIISFTNMRPTNRGGTHAEGLRRGINNALTSINYFRPNDPLFGSAPGYTAVVAVRLRQPRFNGPTAANLYNKEVLDPITAIVQETVQDRLNNDKGLKFHLDCW